MAWQMMLGVLRNNAAIDAPPAGASTHTWNSADKSAGITLSGGDLVATHTSGTTEGVRGTVALTGKKCWAVQLTQDTFVRLGIATTAHNLDSTAVGAGTTSCVHNSSSGVVLYNGSGVASYGTIVLNDVLLVAFDADTREVWFGEGTTWNGDPGAGTGEATTVAAGTWHPVFGTNTVSQPAGVTLVAFPTSPPTGFTALEPA